MPSIPLPLGAYKRSGFPEIVTVNCYAETTPAKPSQSTALIARPGQENFKTVGTAPIRALFQRQGLFSDAALVVAKDTVYTLSADGSTVTYTGAIAGDERVDVDGGLDANGDSVARIANGSAMYVVEASTGTVTQEDFPVAGGPGATSVCFHKGYWIGVQVGTDAAYYIPPAGTTWGALEFASAEYAPDKLQAVRSVGEMVALLGQASTEFWRATGNITSPLEPYGGMSFPIGCKARDSAVNCQGTLIWVTDTNLVVSTGGGEPKQISDHGLSEQIRNTQAADIRASFYLFDGHPIYRLTLGDMATWDYDLVSNQWTRANSNTYNYARAHLFCSIGDRTLAADSLSNQIWRLDPDRYTDGSDTFTMEWSAVLETIEGPVSVGNVELHCFTGGAPLTGQGSDPQVWMQYSSDGGRTYSGKLYRSLGVTGDYGKRIRWMIGVTSNPPVGLIFKFGISDPVVRRVSGVVVNAP